MHGGRFLIFKMTIVLIINICKEKLHYFEFVKPIEDILKHVGVGFFTREYKKISKEDLARADKIIICGTSLQDNDFSRIENLKFFEWLIKKDFNKPVFGICGGMQVIGLVFSRYRASLLKKLEIGFYKENFKKEFFGLIGEENAYHLHGSYVDFMKSKEFEIICSSLDLVSQAVKHKEKEIYGVLFHPEVRQKGLIEKFVSI